MIEERFNSWFDKEFSPDKFGNLSGVFRQAIKEVAQKAFDEALLTGVAAQHDSILNQEIYEYLETKERHYD